MPTDVKRGSTRSDDHPVVRAADHDLRTPFNVLFGLSELVRDFGDDLTPEQLRRHVASMRDAATLAFSISTRLADFARFQSAAVADAECALDAVLATTVDAHRTRAQQNGTRFDGPSSTGATVRGDERFVALAIETLLENAVKFAGDDGRIAVAAAVDGDWATVRVADDGPGLSVDDPFSPGLKTSVRGPRGELGSGLSLAVARAVVEAFGGALDHGPGLDSAGAGFTLRLRRLPVES